jgi:hypothetical protein
MLTASGRCLLHAGPTVDTCVIDGRLQGTTMEDQDQERHGSSNAERSITLIGLALSVGLAVLLPILARSESSQVEVLLGLAGFTAGYLLTMDVATRRRLYELELRLLDRMEEVEHARFGALPLQRLLTVPDIEDAVRDVVSAAADARAKRMQFLANRTIERIKRDRDETLRISQGIFQCADRREELRLIRYALEDSESTVKAVAGLGLDHWRTHEFAEYVDTYLEFAQRVQQTRIFLVTPDEIADPEMIAVLEHHQQAGVRTYAIDKTSLPSELLRPLVLFDDALLLSHTQSNGNGGVSVHFTDDTLRVRDAKEDFDALARRIERRRGKTVLWPAQPVAAVPPPQSSAQP